jgi:hypothetical protein
MGVAGQRAPSICVSGSHFSATVSATPAGVHARLHVADALAICRAFVADFRAFAADMLVMLSSDQHDVRRVAANLDAGHQQPEVLWFDMLSALFQTVRHRRTKAHLITAQTFVDAGLHSREM